MCLGGDGGGGRFVAEFAFLNTQDKSITIHPMLIFEGSDCRENLLCTLGKLAPQISRLEGATIHVKGRQLRLKIFTLFELCALNAVLGKQGSSVTYFDPWTKVRLDHIRNNKKKLVSPTDNICFLHLPPVLTSMGSSLGKISLFCLLFLDSIFTIKPVLVNQHETCCCSDRSLRWR